MNSEQKAVADFLLSRLSKSTLRSVVAHDRQISYANLNYVRVPILKLAVYKLNTYPMQISITLGLPS